MTNDNKIETRVWVFKTNIREKKDILNIAEVMNIDTISQWTIDQNDCDCVLRVVTQVLSPAEIMIKVTNKGYICSELTD